MPWKHITIPTQPNMEPQPTQVWAFRKWLIINDYLIKNHNVLLHLVNNLKNNNSVCFFVAFFLSFFLSFFLCFFLFFLSFFSFLSFLSFFLSSFRFVLFRSFVSFVSFDFSFGLGPSYYPASLLWSPGPRPSPVFRSVICDCLSLNVPIPFPGPRVVNGLAVPVAGCVGSTKPSRVARGIG